MAAPSASFANFNCAGISMSFVDLVEFSGDAARRRRHYLAALTLIFAAVIVVTAMRFSGWPVAGWRMTSLVDFHDFYLAGALAGTGEAGRAYAFADLIDLQRRMFAATTHAPWTYPPQFDLILGAARAPADRARLRGFRLRLARRLRLCLA